MVGEPTEDVIALSDPRARRTPMSIENARTRRAQRLEWRVQRASWGLMALVVALGCALGEGMVVMRGALLYVVMLVILRVSGKRTVGQLTAFDLVLLLMLSEFTQQTVVGDHPSWGVGLLAVVVLVGIDVLMGWATARSEKLDRMVDGAPLVIVSRGTALHDRLAKEHLNLDEVLAAARREGLERLDQIELAVLEADGRISIITRKRAIFRRARSRTGTRRG